MTGYVKVVKVSQGRYAATHAATEAGELACGTRSRMKSPVVEIGADLDAVTCLSRRVELGMDDRADEADRLEALFVLSITLGLRPGELRKLDWDHVDPGQGVIHVWRPATRGCAARPCSRCAEPESVDGFRIAANPGLRGDGPALEVEANLRTLHFMSKLAFPARIAL